MVGGLMIVLGKKDKPVHVGKGSSLTDRLDWVTDQPVVFYDVESRRAWLVDGASALLHLVRASMGKDRDRPAYRNKWKFNGHLRGSHAAEILSDPDNLSTALYVDRRIRSGSGVTVDVDYTFHDRVDDTLRCVEALIDDQARTATQDGYCIRKSDVTPTKNISGFDFWDVAKHPDSVLRRTHSLSTTGRGWSHGWADYIRCIGALIIFGKGFGSLIRAKSVDALCPGWRTVPAGKELMCVSVETLNTIQGAKGRNHLGAGELTGGILWSSRCQLFAPCPCLMPSPPASPSHIDPVQILLPKTKFGQLDAAETKITLSELGRDGAVVFGHTPYHKTKPKLGSPKSSDQEKDYSSAVSVAGSSGERTAVDGSGSCSRQPSTSTDTSPDIMQGVTIVGDHEGRDGDKWESPENPRKRKWRWWSRHD